MSFILEAEGAILCFILYLIPGFPKDIISYLFGISPMPFWLFAVVSTVARIPGTIIASYFGANVAEQQYIYASPSSPSSPRSACRSTTTGTASSGGSTAGDRAAKLDAGRAGPVQCQPSWARFDTRPGPPPHSLTFTFPRSAHRR